MNIRSYGIVAGHHEGRNWAAGWQRGLCGTIVYQDHGSSPWARRTCCLLYSLWRWDQNWAARNSSWHGLICNCGRKKFTQNSWWNSTSMWCLGFTEKGPFPVLSTEVRVGVKSCFSWDHAFLVKGDYFPHFLHNCPALLGTGFGVSAPRKAIEVRGFFFFPAKSMSLKHLMRTSCCTLSAGLWEGLV